MTDIATSTRMPEADSDLYRYLILDRNDPEQCLWVLAIPGISFPALLDEHNRPLPGELGRAMSTAARLLGYQIYLQSVFGGAGMTHRVLVPIVDGQPQRLSENETGRDSGGDDVDNTATAA